MIVDMRLSESIEFFVYDLEAPVFTFVPADATVECDAPIPTDDATATDNCGEVTITSEDVVSTGGATSFDGCSADFRSELGSTHSALHVYSKHLM